MVVTGANHVKQVEINNKTYLRINATNWLQHVKGDRYKVVSKPKELEDYFQLYPKEEVPLHQPVDEKFFGSISEGMKAGHFVHGVVVARKQHIEDYIRTKKPIPPKNLWMVKGEALQNLQTAFWMNQGEATHQYGVVYNITVGAN